MQRFISIATLFAVMTSIASSVNLDGAYVVEVPLGSTTVIQNTLTGSGYLVVTGGGTVELSGTDNNFTGGIIVSNGVVRASSPNAFGSGDIVLDGTSDLRTVEFNVKDAVFDNGILLKTGSTSHTKPAIKALKNVTLNGNVVVGASLGSSAVNTIYADSNVKATYNGELNAGTAKLLFYGNGKSVIKGKITTDEITCGKNFSDNGSIELWNSNNKIKTVKLYAADIYCKAPNVMKGAFIDFYWEVEWEANAHGFLLLGGYDQEFAGIHSRKGKPGKLAAGAYANALPSSNSDSPCTITLTGRTGQDTSVQCYAGLTGNYSLVINQAQNANALYQHFLYRIHKMTGDITVNNGQIRVSTGATFPNVKNISVSGGVIVFTGVNNAMPALEKLTMTGGEARFMADSVNSISSKTEYHLTSNSKLYLQPGVTNSVNRLYVDGISMPAGTYSYENLPLMKASNPASYTGAIVVRKGPRFVMVIR